MIAEPAGARHRQEPQRSSPGEGRLQVI